MANPLLTPAPPPYESSGYCYENGPLQSQVRLLQNPEYQPILHTESYVVEERRSETHFHHSSNYGNTNPQPLFRFEEAGRKFSQGTSTPCSSLPDSKALPNPRFLSFLPSKHRDKTPSRLPTTSRKTSAAISSLSSIPLLSFITENHRE